MSGAALIAASLITLHMPAHVAIFVNPNEIVLLREPREDSDTLIAKDAGCIVFTSDAKFIAVVETCDAIRAQWPR